MSPSTVEFLDISRAFLLLVAANAVPVLVAKVARGWGAYPLDCGWVLTDGRRLFGDHKTWRGLFTGTMAGALLAIWLDIPASTGATFAFASLTGDALSSTFKRRLDLKPGAEVPGLDQVGETVLPLLLFGSRLDLSLAEGILAGVLFVVLDLACAPLRAKGPKSLQE